MGFFSNLFGRGGRIIRGQVNRGMDAAEAATFEHTVKQTIRDMKTELNKVVRASAEAMSNHNRLEAEYQRHKRQADEWHDRAKKALESGREDLARKALAKKTEAENLMAAMQTSVEKARGTSDQLKRQVSELKNKINEAERNASTLIARKNAARAQKKVAEALAGVGEADNAFSALSSFEESVRREEASAQAYDSMATSADEDLEAEFDKLDVSNTDDELEKLKKELGK